MKHFLLALISFFTLTAHANPEWVKAEVVRIDASRQRIVLKHEYIPSIKMAPMTMRFDVAKEISLEKYRPGEKVRFQIKEAGGDLTVIAMEPLK